MPGTVESREVLLNLVSIATASFEDCEEKNAMPHSLRHSFPTHLLESVANIRTVRELPGHEDVRTTMIYLHVMNKPGPAVKRLADLV